MTNKEIEDANMVVTLKAYLNKLAAIEKAKPESQRRHVPTMAEIASDVGISKNSISIIASNNVKRLNLKVASKIIATIQARGFPMMLTDLLVYIPPENNHSPKIDEKPLRAKKGA